MGEEGEADEKTFRWTMVSGLDSEFCWRCVMLLSGFSRRKREDTVLEALRMMKSSIARFAD